jgi:hypothetical protein
MFAHIPLMIVPLVLYNLGLFGIFGGGEAPWAQQLFSIPMMSGGTFALTLADLMVLIALLLSFFEILKSTRTSNASVIDHLLSTFVFVAFLVEFLLVQGAATSLFFTLTVITFVDVLAGFTVSLRASSRDVNLR